MMVPQNLDFKGSINESIQRAAGYDVDSFILENIYKPKIGEVYALPGGDIAAKHILVGIMPHYRTDFDRNESDLSAVMRKMMELARCMLFSSVAVPPLGSGRKGFAKAKAARLVVHGIHDRMHEGLEEVRIICNDENSLPIFTSKLEMFGWKPA